MIQEFSLHIQKVSVSQKTQIMILYLEKKTRSQKDWSKTTKTNKREVRTETENY